MRIKHRAKKACFKCESTVKTVRITVGVDTFVVCWEHAYDYVPDEPPPKSKEGGNGEAGKKTTAKT